MLPTISLRSSKIFSLCLQVQARYRGPQGDPSVSEVHRAAHPQAPLPASRQGHRAGLNDRLQVPSRCHRCPSGKIKFALSYPESVRLVAAAHFKNKRNLYII